MRAVDEASAGLARRGAAQRLAVSRWRDPLAHRAARRCRGRSRARARSSRAPPIPGARRHARAPRAATAASSALPTPAPRWSGRTNRSSSQIALAREEGREGGEEQRVAGRLRPALGDQRLGRRALAEQRLWKQLLGRMELVGEVLVLGQLPEQLEQQRDVLAAAGRRGRSSTAPLAMPRGQRARGRGARDRRRRSSSARRTGAPAAPPRSPRRRRRAGRAR